MQAARTKVCSAEAGLSSRLGISADSGAVSAGSMYPRRIGVITGPPARTHAAVELRPRRGDSALESSSLPEALVVEDDLRVLITRTQHVP